MGTLPYVILKDTLSLMMDPNSKHWVALYCKSRNEKQVAIRLKEQDGYPMESYLPLRRVLRKWSDRQKWVEVPMFPSYVFVQLTSREYYVASHVEGAVRLVKCGDKVSVVPDHEIDYIKKVLASETALVVENTAALARGSRARIISGPLAGHEGRLVSNCKDGNFSVEVTGINLSVVIDVARDMLEYLPPEKEKKGIFNK